MLHLVGLGLADEKDITVRGLEIVKKAERVYLEAYTAILLVDKAKLVSGFFVFFQLLLLWQIDVLLSMCKLLIGDLSCRKPFMAAPLSKRTVNW
jgi:hypothetical protein